jgi:RNA polymerase sigma factor (sigma-70 family)
VSAGTQRDVRVGCAALGALGLDPPKANLVLQKRDETAWFVELWTPGDPFPAGALRSSVVLRVFRSSPEPQQKRVNADPLLGLARAAQGGDRAATRTLIVSVTPALLRAARGVLGAAHPEVEDTAQEAAFGVVRALSEYREDCSVLHYASRIGVLTALAVRRRLRTRGDGRHDELNPEMPTTEDSPADALLNARRRQILHELCDALPVQQTEALIMHCVLGMSVDEVAAACECPSNTVKSRLRLAKDALRGRIGADPVLGELLGATP